MKDSQSLKNALLNKKNSKKYFVKNLPKVQNAAVVKKEIWDKLSWKPVGQNLPLLLVPFILFLIFFVLTIVNTYIGVQLVTKQVISAPAVSLHPYPVLQTTTAPQLKLSAKAAIVIDADSNIILFEKLPQLRFSMASTTKIMTALVGLDYYHDDSQLQIKPISVEGSQLGLRLGDTVTFNDLLYAMLLPSANDAAITIADNFPGGVPAFVQKMNEKATFLHLYNTHFADPVGLDDDGDYTTVLDLARLGAYARTNNEFASITSTKERVITSRGYGQTYVLTNLNKLLGINGVNGIKTGTTEAAGEVLVASTLQSGHEFIIVVMNSDDRFGDTAELIAFLKNVSYITPEPLPVVN